MIHRIRVFVFNTSILNPDSEVYRFAVKHGIILSVLSLVSIRSGRHLPPAKLAHSHRQDAFANYD